MSVIERKVFQISNKTILGKATFKAPYKFQSPLDNEARYVHVVNGHSNIIYSLGKLALKPVDSLIMKSGNFIKKWEKSDKIINKVKMKISIFYIIIILLPIISYGQRETDDQTESEKQLMRENKVKEITSFLTFLPMSEKKRWTRKI